MENSEESAAKLRQEAADLRQRAYAVADYAERQTLLLQATMLEDRADIEERWQGFNRKRHRSGTGDNTAGQRGLPPPVEWFQLLWLGGMVIGAVYDLAVAVVSDHVEAAIDVLLFACGAALMHCAVRHRSRLARWLLVPFLVVTFVEVFSHDGYVAFDPIKSCLAFAQLGLMVGAAWLLYTRNASCWFSGGATSTR